MALVGFTGIGDAEQSDEFAVGGEIEDGLAIGCAWPRRGRTHRGDGDIELLHQRRVADRDVARIDVAENAASGARFEALDAMRTELRRFGGVHDGRSQGMLAECLEAGGPLHQVLLAVIAERDDGLQGGTALGERSGLVDHHGVHPLHRLQGFGVLDEHAGASAASGAHHDGHGRGQSESARAGDDEHGDGIDQRMRQSRRGAEGEPGDEGDERNADHGGNKDGGNLIGQMLDGGAAALCFADQADDLRQHGLAADALGAHQDGAVAVDAGADDAVAGTAFRRAADSPVISDSSTTVRPSSTRPSTGTFSPGRTRSDWPTVT